LGEADEEALELKLLTDPAYGEEFDTVVDEITDEYVKNELRGDERERVEQYFLTTTERQQKLEFASELLRRAEVERGKQLPVREIVTSRPGFLELLRAFFKRQAFASLATAAAALVLAACLIFIPDWSGNPSSANYAQVTLMTSSSARATGGAGRERVPMPESGLLISFPISEEQRDAKELHAKLLDGKVERDLTIKARTEQIITVAVPADWLSRATTYLIKVERVNPDGRREPARGGPEFMIE